MLKFVNLVFFFILSLVIPQSKKILVFGDRGGNRFTDNSRYLFFYYNHFVKDTKCIWLTKNLKILNYLRNKGFECYFSNSVMGIYYGLRSSWHIFNYSENDTSKYTAMFRKKLNLFHGTAVKYADRKYFKKQEHHSLNNTIFKKINEINFKLFKTYAVFANSDKSFIPWISWKSYFPKNKFYSSLISNLQRNIMLNNNQNYDLNLFRTDKELSIVNKIHTSKKKIIGYFPTFRFDSKELFIDVNDDSLLDELNDFLEKKNSIIVIKKHQNSYSDDGNRFYNPKFDIMKKLSNYKNFLLIGYDVDLASILSSCDIIISDYSSLMMDYLFLERAIILYTPDLSSYSKSPGLALDLINQTFAYKAKNFNELRTLLNDYFVDCLKFNLKHNTGRTNLKNKVFESEDCFKNIVDFVNKY
jgi:CDP-glycerol glycerophosphotransferase (TagB/SpsB family)